VEIYKDLLFKIKYNNNAAIMSTKNSSSHSCIKHTDIKHHWIHKAVKTGEIMVTKIATKENIANLFMKVLL
jgi:hypothetical protein